jgi:hypothetical protein
MGLDPLTMALGIGGSLLAGGQQSAANEREFEYAKALKGLDQQFQREMMRPLDFNQMMGLYNQQLNSRGMYDSGEPFKYLGEMWKRYGITPEGIAPGYQAPQAQGMATQSVGGGLPGVSSQVLGTQAQGNPFSRANETMPRFQQGGNRLPLPGEPTMRKQPLPQHNIGAFLYDGERPRMGPQPSGAGSLRPGSYSPFRR